MSMATESPRLVRPLGLDPSPSPVLSPDVLRGIADEALRWSSADTMSVLIQHEAIGMARVVLGRVRMQDNGDKIQLQFVTRFGRRDAVWLNINQIDATSIRDAVRYMDRTAQQLTGDPVSLARTIPPRHYVPNTTWHPATAQAFETTRHAAVSGLVAPLLDAGLTASAFVGVYAYTRVYADKQGISAGAQETDAELVVTGWTPDGKGAGWAGQAARDWRTLDPAIIAARGIELTRRSANPVAFEPGRRTVIMDRPAVAQIVHAMGPAFDARSTFSGWTPLYNKATRKSRLGERIMDARITMMSDPNDPDGGYIPFNGSGYPLISMTWVDHGVHAHLGFDVEFAAGMGYAPANDAPGSARLQAATTHGLLTVEEMIAACKEGIYVNRFSHIRSTGDDPTVGMMTGVTSGGCFLIRQGKIDKAIKNLRFLDSPWLFLNRLEAIGTSARAPFGYAPWAGEWPIDPTIVPPLMIRDFNFNALADSV